MKRRWYCYVGLSGTFAPLIAFAYHPAFSAFYYSLAIWDGYRPARWAGLQNYKEIFGSDIIFRKAFVNMLILGGWQVVRRVVFPLMGAALIYRVRSERTAYFFRLLFVLPIIVPGVVGIMVWRQLYEPNIGLFNEILKGLGLQPIGWLNDADTALASLMFMGFPWITGVDMLIFLAGLLAIPLEIIEAAIMDGASSWRRFFSMELPLIVPQIRLIVILSAIQAMQGFGWQLLVTEGGPRNSTTVPAWVMYREAVRAGRFGVGTAIGTVLFLIIFAVTLINKAAIRSTVEYQAT